jgi:probable phosphoglycerate mutase
MTGGWFDPIFRFFVFSGRSKGAKDEMVTVRGMGEIRIFVDGASRGNPGPGSYGFVIESVKRRDEGSGFLGVVTNNVAEYCGALRALRAAQQIAIKGDEIRLISDSQLLINQLSGRWKIRNERLRGLKKEIDHITSELNGRGVKIKFEKVPRENWGVRRADALCNSVLDSI